MHYLPLSHLSHSVTHCLDARLTIVVSEQLYSNNLYFKIMIEKCQNSNGGTGKKYKMSSILGNIYIYIYIPRLPRMYGIMEKPLRSHAKFTVVYHTANVM